MKCFLRVAALLIILTAVTGIHAKTKKIPNMVINSKMVCTGVNGKHPDDWTQRKTVTPVVYRNNAPGGGRSVLFANPGKIRNGCADARAFFSLMIEPGEDYRFKVWVRTKNFKGNAGFVMFGPGWRGSSGITKFPKNSNWHIVEAVRKAKIGRGRIFTFALYAHNFSGEIEFAKPGIYPESPAAKVNAYVVRENVDFNLIPQKPRLHRIFSAPNAKLVCRWFNVPGMKHEGKVVYQIDNDSTKTAIIGKDNFVRLDLSNIAPGKHIIKAKTGNYQCTYAITVYPPLPKGDFKRLNNFHAVLSECEIADGGKGSFVNPRDGFVFFRLPAGAKLTIPANKSLFTNGEFKFLLAGKYDYTLSGAAGKVIISAVTETMLYPMANGPLIAGMKPLDFEFCKKYILPNYMLFVGGGKYLNNKDRAMIVRKKRNRLFRSVSYTKFYTLPLKKQAIDKFLDSLKVFSENQRYSPGICIDETQTSGALLNQRGIDMAKYFTPILGQSIYFWVCGGAVTENIRTAKYLQSTAGIAGSVKHIFEAYCGTFADEERALADIDRRFNALKKLAHMSPETYGVNLSHCNLPYKFSVYRHPGVNYKYFLDLQFNRLANDPVFKDIPLVGFWGAHYADRELNRFAAALIRHYVLEGKTKMFTAQWKYKYLPGHLINGDFDKGFKNWRTEGNLKVGYVRSFGEKIQRRNAASLVNAGNHFAVFTRGDKPNKLSQRATKLVPGRLYSLRYLSGDYANLRTKKHMAVKLTLKINGGEIIDELSEHTQANGKGFAKGHFDKVVFRAKCADPVIVFSDEKNATGIKSYLNFVSLMPYFKIATP